MIWPETESLEKWEECDKMEDERWKEKGKERDREREKGYGS